MRITGGAQCVACGEIRPSEHLLKVTSLTSGRTHYVCRPAVEGLNPNCFRRGTCYAGHHAIAPVE